jgi:hypothetical protein
MREKINEYKILVGKLLERGLLGRFRLRQYDITEDHKVGCG